MPPLCNCCRGDYDFEHKYFCNQKSCFYFTEDFDSKYNLFKAWNWDNNTEYYPSDEDISHFEHRVLAKISKMKGKGYVRKHLVKLLELKKLTSDHAEEILSQLRIEYNYEFNRSQFFALCDLYTD